MKYWLMKSEGKSYSIDHLKRDKVTPWEGVRNYQARNHMLSMEKGDMVLFYHSDDTPSGIYGIGKVAALAHPDMTQFKKTSMYFDPKATTLKPVWQCVDVAFVRKLKEPIPLSEIKLDPQLEGMLVRARGSRLSVQPVSEKHFKYITDSLAA